MDKKPCVFCRALGHNGAQWILKIGNDPGMLVHKPCGAKLAAKAPNGVQVKLVMSREARDAVRVKRFWEQKFQEAKVASEARAKATK
jgi:hypothetical protein